MSARPSSLAPISWRAQRYRLLVLAVSAIALAALSQLPDAPVGERLLRWNTLVPPTLALTAVLLTRRVIPSLLLAVVAASLIGRAPVEGLAHGADSYIWQNITDPWHLAVAGFVTSILVTVKITDESGGTRAAVQAVEGLLRSARAVKLGTFGLGILVFFDDYANTMLVGPSMRPLADRYRVSREKLAYIVDSTAAPIAGLAIVSTWVGYEVGLLDENTRSLGLDQGGYALLLQALPLRFYCVFALATVFINSVLGRDFGPMLKAERRTLETLPPETEERIRRSTEGNLLERHLWLNAALPMGVLLLAVLVGLFIDGGGVARLQEGNGPWALDFWQATLSASDNGEKVLLTAALIALAVATLTSLASKALTPRSLAAVVGRGLRAALFPLSILICAWGLGSACKAIGTGAYLVTQLAGTLPALLIPVTTFLAAALVALATGTSWGTMAIVVPAAVPLAHSVGGFALLLPTVAAVLDGAIFGDHCSPMSDTTLLSSAATECDTIAHVWSQLPYAVTAMVCGASAYVLVAFGVSPWLIYPAGIAALWLTFRIAGRTPHQA